MISIIISMKLELTIETSTTLAILLKFHRKAHKTNH